MSDVAALGFQIDSSQATTASTNLDKMTAAAGRAEAASTKLGGSSKTAAANISQQAAIIESATAKHVAQMKAVNDNAAAHSGLSAQASAAQHSIRSMIEQIAMGISPTQALTSQANRLAFVASGPGGLSAGFSQAAASLKNLISPTVLVVGGLAAVVGGAALAIHSLAELAKQFDDTARASGTSVANLQGFANAASFKGIGNADFLKAMDQFAGSVYQAQHNMGSLAEVFRANNANAKTFDDYLLKASDLIKGAGTDQAKLQLLQQMGLPATMDWVRFLGQGADGIKRARDEAVKFNETAEGQLIGKAREFDDAWNKAWTNFGNYAKNGVLSAATGIQSLINGANDLIAKGLLKAGVNVGSNLLRDAFLGGPTPSNRLTSSADTSSFYNGLGTGAPGNSKPTGDPNVLKNQMSLEQQRIGILGQMATVEQQVRAVELAIQQARLAGVTVTAAEEANLKRLAQAQALGTFQIKAQADAEQVRMAAMLMSTQAGIAYEIVQTKINEAKQKGVPLNEQQIADLQKEADAYAKVKVQADNLTTLIGDLKGGAQAFGNTLVQGLMSGKSAMDALSAATKSLGQTLVSSGIKNLIEGLASQNYVQAAIGGAEAIGGALLGSDSSAEKEKKNQAAVQSYVRQQQFIQQAQLAGVDQSTLSGQLQAFDIGAQQQRLQEQLAGGQAMVQLEQSLAAQRTAIVQKSVDDSRKALQALGAADKSDVAQKLDAIHTAADQLSTALQTLGQSTAEVATGVAAAVAKVKSAFDSDLQSKINSAKGQGYLNDIQNLVKERSQLISDSAALGSDPGQVTAYFNAQAQSIIDNAQLSGDAFNDLIKQFPQLANVVHQFAGSLKDLQDQIMQYLASLQIGSLSTLSPTDKLNASAQQFQQILAAVQGGDFTKSGQLTQAADAYLTQAQSFFASGPGYASVFNAVTQALQAVSGVSGLGSSATLATGAAAGGNAASFATPQLSVAANDNTAQQTQALSQVLAQGFNGLGSAINTSGNEVADLLRELISEIKSNRSRPMRPASKSAA